MSTYRNSVRTVVIALVAAGVLIATASTSFAATVGKFTSYSNGTVCRNYDQYADPYRRTFDTVYRAGSLCVAPSKAYPSYKGSLGIVGPTNPIPQRLATCDFSYFPYDRDEPQPMLACPAIAGPFIAFWKYSANGWQKVSFGFTYGTKVYVYPMTADWRWVHTANTGWVAMPASDIALRWFVPAA